MYGPFSTFIGTGAVGGLVPSFEAMGREAGQIVNRLADGAAAATLKLPALMPNELSVDWRAAHDPRQFWPIDVKRQTAGPQSWRRAFHALIDRVMASPGVTLYDAAESGVPS